MRSRSAEVDRIALSQDERVLSVRRVPVLGSSRLAGAVRKRWYALHSTEGLFCWCRPGLLYYALGDGKSSVGHATGRRQRWQPSSANSLATIGWSPYWGRAALPRYILVSTCDWSCKRPSKCSIPHLTGQEAEHFQQEAQTIAKLTHPAIVRVFDYDVQDGVPVLMMDYAREAPCDGAILRARWCRCRGSSSSVKQVADGLCSMHMSSKFIHRDVKPENMLVGRREEVLLCDFGLAALAHSSPSLSTQEAMGTPPYMAPEQIEGHPRAASDQYALGIVVYEWLCGSRPFEGSATEVMVQQLTMPPPPLHEHVATIPLGIRAGRAARASQGAQRAICLGTGLCRSARAGQPASIVPTRASSFRPALSRSLLSCPATPLPLLYQVTWEMLQRWTKPPISAPCQH